MRKLLFTFIGVIIFSFLFIPYVGEATPSNLTQQETIELARLLSSLQAEVEFLQKENKLLHESRAALLTSLQEAKENYQILKSLHMQSAQVSDETFAELNTELSSTLEALEAAENRKTVANTLVVLLTLGHICR